MMPFFSQIPLSSVLSQCSGGILYFCWKSCLHLWLYLHPCHDGIITWKHLPHYCSGHQLIPHTGDQWCRWGYVLLYISLKEPVKTLEFLVICGIMLYKKLCQIIRVSHLHHMSFFSEYSQQVLHISPPPVRYGVCLPFGIRHINWLLQHIVFLETS